jgi:GDP-4-dehydro-6-deoxy-D-mannose reductase
MNVSERPSAQGLGGYQSILLTGGAGFVGRYLREALARAYPSARRIVMLRPGEASGTISRDARWAAETADLVSAEEVERLVGATRPDLVVHLAAQASAAQSIRAAEETWRVNFGGSLHLASALARHAPEAAVLFVSSAEVYGGRLADGPATEDTSPCPLNAYARSKIAAEGMFADVLPQTARLVVARPFNHVGPGQDSRFALPSFASQIAGIESGRLTPRLQVGDLSVARDFLDVRDVVDAYVGLVAAAPGLPPRSIFNIASGAPQTLASLLEAMRGHARRQFDIVVDEARLRPSETPVAAGDASRLRAATGWRPARAIDETLVDLLEHWRARESDAQEAQP